MGVVEVYPDQLSLGPAKPRPKDRGERTRTGARPKDRCKASPYYTRPIDDKRGMYCDVDPTP